MNYISTRNKNITVTSAQAIAQGISVDGGLFVPQDIPVLSPDDYKKLCGMKYTDRAKFILKQFLTDFSDEELDRCVKGAYTGSFDDELPAPVSEIENGIEILELWHGPTCAFKDLALQLLPYLLTASAKKTSDGKKTVILVATSGDTGKAALEGFKDVENTEIIVFYPNNGVSAMQKLQMASQKGGNVHVCAIEGNFDDAQSAVKKIFTDASFKEKLSENGMQFSSANSINWGRLVPQIVYYVSAYCDLVNKGSDLSKGFNVTVPTGNFGNILAAYYAKNMGVPINKLVCASNENNVLTDFINTGIYDKNRPFHTTISPSMDILISSNLERLLYAVCSGDTGVVASLQESLAKTGRYQVNEEMKNRIGEDFYAGFCDDDATRKTIKETFDKYGYLCDTHTAVAVNVAGRYIEETADKRPMLIVSTASAYKFPKSVLTAICGNAFEDEFENLDKLSAVTGTKIPSPIVSLKNAEVRFKDIYKKEDIQTAVENCLF